MLVGRHRSRSAPGRSAQRWWGRGRRSALPWRVLARHAEGRLRQPSKGLRLFGALRCWLLLRSVLGGSTSLPHPIRDDPQPKQHDQQELVDKQVASHSVLLPMLVNDGMLPVFQAGELSARSIETQEIGTEAHSLIDRWLP